MDTEPIKNIVSRPIETQRGDSLSRRLFKRMGINTADRIERRLSQLIAELKINTYFAFFLVSVTFLSLIIPHRDNFCFKILDGLTIAIIFYTFYLIIVSLGIGFKIFKEFIRLYKQKNQL